MIAAQNKEIKMDNMTRGQLIEEINLLGKVVTESLDTANKAVAQSEEFSAHAASCEQTNLDLVQTIKNIHIVLNSKMDMFKDDIKMQELMSHLAVFIASPATIKAGVMKNATNQE